MGELTDDTIIDNCGVKMRFGDLSSEDQYYLRLSQPKDDIIEDSIMVEDVSYFDIYCSDHNLYPDEKHALQHLMLETCLSPIDYKGSYPGICESCNESAVGLKVLKSSKIKWMTHNKVLNDGDIVVGQLDVGYYSEKRKDKVVFRRDSEPYYAKVDNHAECVTFIKHWLLGDLCPIFTIHSHTLDRHYILLRDGGKWLITTISDNCDYFVYKHNGVFVVPDMDNRILKVGNKIVDVFVDPWRIRSDFIYDVGLLKDVCGVYAMINGIVYVVPKSIQFILRCENNKLFTKNGSLVQCVSGLGDYSGNVIVVPNQDGDDIVKKTLMKSVLYDLRSNNVLIIKEIFFKLSISKYRAPSIQPKYYFDAIAISYDRDSMHYNTLSHVYRRAGIQSSVLKERRENRNDDLVNPYNVVVSDIARQCTKSGVLNYTLFEVRLQQYRIRYDSMSLRQYLLDIGFLCVGDQYRKRGKIIDKQYYPRKYWRRVRKNLIYIFSPRDTPFDAYVNEIPTTLVSDLQDLGELANMTISEIYNTFYSLPEELRAMLLNKSIVDPVKLSTYRKHT